MAAALPTADPAAADLIAHTLLLRRHTEGGLGLLSNFQRLTPGIRAAVVDDVDELYSPIRKACSHGRPETRRNAITVIEQGQAARLAYLVAEQLRHGPTENVDSAGGCLLSLARTASRYCQRGQDLVFDAASSRFVVSAVGDAAESYGRHHNMDVLSALCELAPRFEPRILEALRDVSHATVEPLRTVLCRPHRPAVRRALLALLSMRTMTGPALAGIRYAAQEGGLAHVLETAHLATTPPNRAVLARITLADTLIPRPGQRESGYTPKQSLGLVFWIDALPIERHLRIREFADLARINDLQTRLASLRRLITEADGPEAARANDAIAGYSVDGDPRVARIALRHLIRARWPELNRLLFHLVNTAHPDIQELCRLHVAPVAFERLWDTWPKLDFARQLEAGRALLKLDPAFHKKLSDRLASKDRTTRLQAISIIRGLNQSEFFEQPLQTLAEDDDVRVSSAAVRALGGAGSEASMSLLQSSLAHQNGRVRANAVEALHQMEASQHVRTLMDMAEVDDSPRPRANAIGALMHMHAEDALGSLSRMLTDHRETHRVSALWLVDHMGLVEMARHVAELAVSDDSDAVRRQANKVIHHLIRALNSARESLSTTDDSNVKNDDDDSNNDNSSDSPNAPPTRKAS